MERFYKRGKQIMSGNKHDNGVHEIGTPETIKAYQEDTPGQEVEKYLAGINEVIQEKKEKQKKSFMQVFQNPLKGFPYNEELDDNFIAPLEEKLEEEGPCWTGFKQVGMKKKNGKDVPNCVPMNEEELEKAGIKKEDVDYSHLEEGYGKIKDNHYDVKISVKKNDVKNVVKGINKLTGGNQYEYEDIDMDGVYPYGKSDGDIYVQGDDAGSLGLAIQKMFRNKVQVVGESVEIEEGKMGELFLDIQNGATAKDIARDYPVSMQQAKDFLKDYYSQKKKPMKMGEETEILRNYDSLLEAKNLMPAIQKIVDTKGAAKVGGVMLDMFTASVITQAYDKVNDANKKRMESSNIQTLVKLAQRLMGMKEETVSEGKKIQDIVRKHKRELQKVQKSGNLELSKKAEDELSNWASSNGEIRGDNEDEFIEWLDNNLDDLVKGKIKEDVSEKYKPYSSREYPRCIDFYVQFRGGRGDRILSDENRKDFIKATDMIDAYCRKNKIRTKPVYSTPQEGSSAYKVGLIINGKSPDYKNGVDLQPLYVALSKLKTAEDHGGGWDKASIKESNDLQEGTWAVPDSYPKLVALQKFLRTPHKAKTAKDVLDFTNNVYSHFGDDSFFDDLGAYGTTLPGGEKDFDGTTHSAEYMKRAKKYNKIKKGTDLNLVLIKQLGDWTGNVLKFKGVEMVEFPREWYLNDNPKHKKDDSPVKAKLESVEEGKGMKRGRGNLRFKKQDSIKVEGKMDGGKLTGQEISVYFRRNKVRDKMTRKAVEIALDHGGAMNYAIKQIEKLKRGLSKNKDVEKALNYANFGEQVKVPSVGFMFKEDSPIAGNIQVEGDPYIPQKKGVNKNIANYWNKEIKGLKPKELEAIQSMYMITDHSGVVQMYKAGKRAFIKSIKN